MSALPIHEQDPDVPPIEEQGRTDADRETFLFLRETMRNMRRSMRRARPTPREGIEAGLDLMLAAVEERLGVEG